MTIVTSTLICLPSDIISLIMDYFPPGGLYVPTFETFYNIYKNSSAQERAFIQQCMVEKISSIDSFKAEPGFITIQDDEITIKSYKTDVVLNSSKGKLTQVSDGGMLPGKETIEMGFSYNELEYYRLDAVGTRFYGYFNDNTEEVNKHEHLTAAKDLRTHIKSQEQERSLLVLFANYFPLMQEPQLKSEPAEKNNEVDVNNALEKKQESGPDPSSELNSCYFFYKSYMSSKKNKREILKARVLKNITSKLKLESNAINDFTISNSVSLSISFKINKRNETETYTICINENSITLLNKIEVSEFQSPTRHYLTSMNFTGTALTSWKRPIYGNTESSKEILSMALEEDGMLKMAAFFCSDPAPEESVTHTAHFIPWSFSTLRNSTMNKESLSPPTSTTFQRTNPDPSNNFYLKILFELGIMATGAALVIVAYCALNLATADPAGILTASLGGLLFFGGSVGLGVTACSNSSKEASP